MKYFVTSMLVATLFAASGCGQTIYKPVNVEVPVSEPCASVPPAPPSWPTLALKKDAGMVDRVRALTAENELRKGWEKKLQASITGCTATASN